MNLLKKLSVKAIVGTIKTPAVGSEVPLCLIMGFARTSEVKTTTYGDSIGFHGDFKGIDSDSGEEFRSGVCYLPDVATDLLDNAMRGADGNAVEFGFAISVLGVKGRTDAETGKYEYRVKPLMESAANDPLVELEDRLKALALPKPKAEVKKGGK